MREIADQVGARLWVDMALRRSRCGGAHPNPLDYADIATSTTHKTLRGPRWYHCERDEDLGKKLNSAVFPGLQGGH